MTLFHCRKILLAANASAYRTPILLLIAAIMSGGKCYSQTVTSGSDATSGFIIGFFKNDTKPNYKYFRMTDASNVVINPEDKGFFIDSTDKYFCKEATTIIESMTRHEQKVYIEFTSTPYGNKVDFVMSRIIPPSRLGDLDIPRVDQNKKSFKTIGFVNGFGASKKNPKYRYFTLINEKNQQIIVNKHRFYMEQNESGLSKTMLNMLQYSYDSHSLITLLCDYGSQGNRVVKARKSQ